MGSFKMSWKNKNYLLFIIQRAQWTVWILLLPLLKISKQIINSYNKLQTQESHKSTFLSNHREKKRQVLLFVIKSTNLVVSLKNGQLRNTRLVWLVRWGTLGQVKRRYRMHSSRTRTTRLLTMRLLVAMPLDVSTMGDGWWVLKWRSHQQLLPDVTSQGLGFGWGKGFSCYMSVGFPCLMSGRWGRKGSCAHRSNAL